MEYKFKASCIIDPLGTFTHTAIRNDFTSDIDLSFSLAQLTIDLGSVKFASSTLSMPMPIIGSLDGISTPVNFTMNYACPDNHTILLSLIDCTTGLATGINNICFIVEFSIEIPTLVQTP